MKTNRTFLRAKEYIEYKRSLGFKLKHKETILNNFVNYILTNDYDGQLTRKIVLEWVSDDTADDKTMGRKIEVICPFSKYAASFDEEAEAIYL